MRRRINIYIEGQGEIVFFTQLIKHHFNKIFSIEENKIVAKYRDDNLNIELRVFDKDSNNGGIDNEKIKQLMQEIKDNFNLGHENYIIVDADTGKHRPAGGFTAREQYFNQKKTEYSIDFNLFLIPNHSSDGNLEDLLNMMIGERGKEFYNCLHCYIECLKNIQNSDDLHQLKAISDFNKKKFEWYIWMCEDTNETQSTKRNYNLDIWNLEAEGVQPLLNFLKQIFED